MALLRFSMNLKGPQPPEPEQKPPVSKWVIKIQELEQRVTALEIYIKDLELDCAQARLALCNLVDGLSVAQSKLQKGLTSNPYPMNLEQKKVWEEVIQRNDPKSVLHQNTNNLPH